MTDAGGLLIRVSRDGAVSIDAPGGWQSVAGFRRGKPWLLRFSAPDLPPADTWPAQWVEAWEARARAHEAAGSSEEFAAYDDLRVAVWLGTVADLIPSRPQFVDDPATLGTLGPQWWSES